MPRRAPPAGCLHTRQRSAPLPAPPTNARTGSARGPEADGQTRTRRRGRRCGHRGAPVKNARRRRRHLGVEGPVEDEDLVVIREREGHRRIRRPQHRRDRGGGELDGERGVRGHVDGDVRDAAAVGARHLAPVEHHRDPLARPLASSAHDDDAAARCGPAGDGDLQRRRRAGREIDDAAEDEGRDRLGRAMALGAGRPDHDRGTLRAGELDPQRAV
ncbi:MAG: hypothetical protein ACK56I_13305, partial [bacterium]